MAKDDFNNTYTKLFLDAKFKPTEHIVSDNLLFEGLSGSRAYGMNNIDSDYDIVAIFMNSHTQLYPQKYGYIHGFDDVDSKAIDHIEYKSNNKLTLNNGDVIEGEWRSFISFASLVTYKSSPNLIELLFSKSENITYIHKSFKPIMDNASKFISIKTMNAFMGYIYSQLNRMRKDVSRDKCDNSKRQIMMDTVGYDYKMGYHVLRLMDVMTQLSCGDTQLDFARNAIECKRMRDGAWGTWEEFNSFCSEKLTNISNLFFNNKYKLPLHHRVDEIRNIINSAIEEYYGNVDEDFPTKYITKCDCSLSKIIDRLDRIELKISN